MLESIQSPEDLKNLTYPQLDALAAEIRQALIDGVSRTGGHLASNLGAVELTIALHRVLSTPEDKILFDVGHQSYTHKLLTGRQDLLGTLRREGGISGFPKREESAHDAFETGHASTALSAALGIARARDLRGEDFAVAALVGDGAFTGGMCYEALNDAGSRPTQLIMLLNDNEMSIAQNVGALSKYLTRLRGSRRWIGTKRSVKRGVTRIPLLGRPLFSVMDKAKRITKLLLVRGEFFEALGLGYLGPVDGHDIETLERALRDAVAMGTPVVVHAMTKKGKGYERAERRPELYHGVAPFFVESGESRGYEGGVTVSSAEVVSEAMLALGETDAQVMAITAAMAQGTGLSAFAQAYPDRFFDVGIAEEHAMTLAAGMAAAGMRPIFAVYASFLQRAVDQLLHDACLQRLPVTVLAGNAGFVVGDGATHQGVYDLSALRAMPNLTIWTPCDARELRAMIAASRTLDGPCVIRIPKRLPEALGNEGPAGQWRRIEMGRQVHLVGYGQSVLLAREAAALLRARGVDCAVWSASSISDLDEAALAEMQKGALVTVVEEARKAGGLGEAMAAHLLGRPEAPRVLLMGIEGPAPEEHSLEGLIEACGLTPEHIAQRMEAALREE